jgi:hypothetical protein
LKLNEISTYIFVDIHYEIALVHNDGATLVAANYVHPFFLVLFVFLTQTGGAKLLIFKLIRDVSEILTTFSLFLMVLKPWPKQ